MSDLENVMKIINEKKEIFLKEKIDLTKKRNLENFKELLKDKQGDNKEVFILSYALLTFILSHLISVYKNIIFNTEPVLLAPVITAMCLSFFPSLVTVVFFESNNYLRKKIINFRYFFYKIKSKRNQKIKLEAVLSKNFINQEIIDHEVLNKVKNIIKKENMLEFLALNKNNLTYSSLIEFLPEKEEKELIIKKQSTETLVNLVDTIYLEDKIK